MILMGNLGRDPDVHYLEGNIAVAKFPLATTETYKDKTGRQVSQTEWHMVVLWRGLAELTQKYLHKGSSVYIEGRLKTRSWDDREGNKRFATEVICENMIMLDKKGDGNHHPAHEHPQEGLEGFGNSDIPPASDSLDGLPF